MTDFDYKKYSLEHLENWLHDAISSGEASPQEVYDVITKVVKEQYYYYKDGTSKTYELLALLNGNGVGHIKAYDDVVDKVLSCDKDNTSPECKGAWNDFWEPANGQSHSDYWYDYDRNSLDRPNPFNQQKKNEHPEQPKTYTEMIADGYEMTADGFWIKEDKKDKVVKWQLPVEQDLGSDDYYITFPDDLLEAANLKEGDAVEWIDNNNGSYTLKRVENPT